jgi:hypothetical protein
MMNDKESPRPPPPEESSPTRLPFKSPKSQLPVHQDVEYGEDHEQYEFALRQQFAIQEFGTAKSPDSTISKIEGPARLLRAKTSAQLLSMVNDSVIDEQEKISNFINLLKAGEMMTKGTEFRQRRLTYSQEAVNPNGDSKNPNNAEKTSLQKSPIKPPRSRTSIFASSEIGVVQERKPPFPPNVLGTYSCHGIEPSDQEEDGIHEKINQDRGCIVYPYNSKKNEALFMVLDGHGEQGDQVSEFVMRQVVVSLERDPALDNNPEIALKNAYITTNTALLVTEIQSMTSGCTCVTIYCRGNTLYVANAGDSRAVIAYIEEDGNLGAKNLTRDHKPDDPDEKARIVSWGGFVCPPHEEGLSSRVYLDAEYTMIGLAMSRSVGKSENDKYLYKNGV